MYHKANGNTIATNSPRSEKKHAPVCEIQKYTSIKRVKKEIYET